MKRNQLRNRKVNCLQKIRGSKISLFLMLFVFLLWGVGCSGETPAPAPPVRAKAPSVEKKKAEPVQVAAKVEKKEEIEYSYNPAGKPDPFKPFIQLTPKDAPKIGVHGGPLQKYDISQLKLVAIITGPEGSIALVEDSVGKGFFLRKGTLIGKNDGRVKQILKDRVIIEEVYQDIFGQTKSNETSMYLHRLEEGGES